jgi:hypothetical protein
LVVAVLKWSDDGYCSGGGTSSDGGGGCTATTEVVLAKITEVVPTNAGAGGELPNPKRIEAAFILLWVRGGGSMVSEETEESAEEAD